MVVASVSGKESVDVNQRLVQMVLCRYFVPSCTSLAFSIFSSSFHKDLAKVDYCERIYQLHSCGDSGLPYSRRDFDYWRVFADALNYCTHCFGRFLVVVLFVRLDSPLTSESRMDFE